MAYWIEPFDLNGDYYLGSDGCVRLDGRFGLQRAIKEGVNYCLRLRFVKGSIAGFRVSRGNKPSQLFPVTAIRLPRE